MSRLTLSVAMATYNGEKFLEDQLLSIAKQTRLPDEMVISDDGSTDATMAILERFARNSPFPVRVYRNLVSLGYGDNFIKAASLCQGDLIAFSDQDDVWLANRLAKSLPYFDDNQVLLSVHSGVAVDEQLQPLGFKWPAIPRTGVGYECEPMKYPYPGFAIVVRKTIPGFFAKPRPIELQGSKQMPHDNWVCLLARVYGKIAIIEEPLVLYHRHQTTTTVIHNYSTSERIQLSSKVLFSEEYLKIADWIGQLIDCLQKIETKGHRSSLQQSEVAIQRYRRKQHAYAERARLYASQPSFLDRFCLLMTMVIRGRYFSGKMGNLGVKSFLKDAAYLLDLI
jgi:glycosyltransferase involved in cell wall biosynthesis